MEALMNPIHFLGRDGIRGINHDSEYLQAQQTRRKPGGNDIALALGGLPPTLSSFALLAFCHHEDEYKKVKGNLAVKAMRYAREKNYKIKNSTLSGLSEVALLQSLQPACPVCEGKPIRRVNDRILRCGKCLGRGKVLINATQTAKICKLNRKSILDSHVEVICYLYELICKWESEVLGHVKAKIRDHE